MTQNAGTCVPPPFIQLLAQHKLALFLDFDGTLVDIADHPDHVLVGPDLTDHLHNLDGILSGRLAIITGRPLTALDGFLGKNQIKAVGSHGCEYRGAPVPPAPLSSASLQKIAQLHQIWPKLVIEPKPFGIAVHYRQEPDAASSVLSTMESLAKIEKLAAKTGKMLVELGPKNTNKGKAVMALMQTNSFQHSTPIFIGDDVTDEDGFLAARQFGGQGILVGPPRPTAATYRLSTPADVLRWLGL